MDEIYQTWGNFAKSSNLDNTWQYEPRTVSESVGKCLQLQGISQADLAQLDIHWAIKH